MSYETLLMNSLVLQSASLDDENIEQLFDSYQKALKDLLDDKSVTNIYISKTDPIILIYDLLLHNRVNSNIIEDVFKVLPSSKKCDLAKRNYTYRKYLTISELKSIVSMTQCCVCLEVCTTYPLRQCSHYLCKPCSIAMSKSEALSMITCPLCRTETKSYIYKKRSLTTPTNN